jgi:hypothetical protein
MSFPKKKRNSNKELQLKPVTKQHHLWPDNAIAIADNIYGLV